MARRATPARWEHRERRQALRVRAEATAAALREAQERRVDRPAVRADPSERRRSEEHQQPSLGWDAETRAQRAFRFATRAAASPDRPTWARAPALRVSPAAHSSES